MDARCAGTDIDTGLIQRSAMDMVNNEYAIGQERLKAEKVKHAKVVKENDALKSKTKSAIYVGAALFAAAGALVYLGCGGNPNRR